MRSLDEALRGEEDPVSTVYAIDNAIVVTHTDDIIDAAIRARRMWNQRHPGTVMPEGQLDVATHCVWFPRPQTSGPCFYCERPITECTAEPCHDRLRMRAGGTHGNLR